MLSKGGGKLGHIVAETLLLMTFPCARKLGNICYGHKMFLNKIRNIFVSRSQNLCPQQVLRARANGETFVSATMCPQQCADENSLIDIGAIQVLLLLLLLLLMCPRLPVP